MFVDDTGCGCNVAGMNVNTVMEQAQHNSQKHSDYVETTGGLIAADKSHFYHIKWILASGFQIPVEDSEITSSMYLLQGDGIRREIKRLGIREEHKTLGCWVNPLGVQHKAFQQIKQFILDWRGRMLHSGLSSALIRQSYQTELLSQLKYRLPIYMLSEEQCDNLMKYINPVILHSYFLNKNYPRSLLQANEQYGGLSIHHLYDVMGIEKSKFMIMHLRRNDTTGKLLQIAMQHTQLECGSERLFFNTDYSKYSDFTTPSWCKHLWQYYDKRAIKVDLQNEVTYKKPRQNDQFIMDVLLHENGVLLSKMELIKLNKVRQHLKILTLADITDLRGRRILQQVKEGRLCRKSSFTFAPQDPQDAWIHLWKNKACSILQKALNKKPLGAWTQQTHQIWKWTYSQELNLLQGPDKRCYKKNKYSKYVEIDVSASGMKEQCFCTCADVDVGQNDSIYIVAMEKSSRITMQNRANRHVLSEGEKNRGASLIMLKTK